MITKHAHPGITYSVVDLPDARHVYAAAVPRAGGDLVQQARDALGAIGDVMDQHAARGGIVRQTVFVADAGQIEACRRLVENFYAQQMPATTYVAQPPCPTGLVAIEACGVAERRRRLQIERRSNQLVVIRQAGVAWCHCGNVTATNPNGSLHADAIDAFGRMAQLLNDAGFDYAQVVRTWLYLGSITGPEAALPRYQELNRARAEFYDDVAFSHGHAEASAANGRFYPASTGIGAAGRGVAMSCIALASRRDEVRVVALENPNQTPASEYDARYGTASPRFARAVAVAAEDVATVFVSGTASITGTESRHVGDVQGQTHQTLDNIAALMTPANFARHGLNGYGATLDGLAQLRVYLKNAADYDAVCRICRERLGHVPAIYAVADVCRPELLVEIEAVGFAARVTANVAM